MVKKAATIALTVVALSLGSCVGGGPGAKAWEKEYDVAIIGAGMGGLSCGAYLAKAGMKVLICEQHSVPGGYCTSFERDGFTFETTIHSLQECGEGELIYQTLEDLGIQDEIKFIPLDPARRVVGKDYDLTLSSDIKQLEDDLVAMFPAEKEAIHELIADAITFDVENPELMMSYLGKTNGDIIEPRFQDPKLKLILYSIGGPPQTQAMWGLIPQLNTIYKKNNYFPEGGGHALANLFARTFKEYGGDLALNTLVTKILIEDGKAVGLELESGEKIKAKYVVSNADARLTFLKLVGEEWLPEEFTQKLLEMEVWPSAFLVSLGVDMDLESMGFGGEVVHYSPAESIEELTTTDPRKMSIDIIIQSLRDPSLAPPGKHAASIMALLPYHYMDNWHTKDGKRGEEYRKLKEQVADQLIASAENVIPGLSEHIVYQDVATPLTYERYTLNYQGSIMGWLSTPENMAWIYGWGQRTPIENLYQAGHWAGIGGIPTVIFSGKTAADLILKDIQEAK